MTRSHSSSTADRQNFLLSPDSKNFFPHSPLFGFEVKGRATPNRTLHRHDVFCRSKTSKVSSVKLLHKELFVFERSVNIFNIWRVQLVQNVRIFPLYLYSTYHSVSFYFENMEF